MNRFIFIIGVVGGSSVSRLRYLHDHLVECLGPSSGKSPLDPNTRDKLITSGLKFVRNEGEGELNDFINTLTVARDSKVSSAGLDDMCWGILECLIQPETKCEASLEVPVSVVQMETKPGASANLEVPVAVVQMETKPAASRPQITVVPVSEARVDSAPLRMKRRRDESEDSVRRLLQKLCSGYRNPQKVFVNARYLAKQHVDMAHNGDWEELKRRHDLLTLAQVVNADYLLCDAYRVMLSEAPYLAISAEESAEVERKYMRRSSSRHELVKYLESLVRNASSFDRRVVSRMLFNDAHAGRFDALEEKVNVLLTAGLPEHKVGGLVQSSLKYLQQHH